MSDVKRYDPNYAAMSPADDLAVEAEDGMFVLATDYAALEAELAKLRAGQEPVRFWFIGDAGQQKGATYCKKSSRDGSLAFFECEEDAKRAALRHPGTEVYPVEYYRKPQATPQPSAVPDGWKLVPVEATREMCLAAAQERREYPIPSDRESPVVLWRAMLAAAPPAPATVQGDGNIVLNTEAQQIIAQCIGAHAYIVGALENGRPDLAITEAKKWVDAFGAAARQEGKV